MIISDELKQTWARLGAEAAVAQLESSQRMVELLRGPYVRRTWRERLLSWPWRPWVSKKIDDQWTPREITLMRYGDEPPLEINRIE